MNRLLSIPMFFMLSLTSAYAVPPATHFEEHSKERLIQLNKEIYQVEDQLQDSRVTAPQKKVLHELWRNLMEEKRALDKRSRLLKNLEGKGISVNVRQ